MPDNVLLCSYTKPAAVARPLLSASATYCNMGNQLSRDAVLVSCERPVDALGDLVRSVACVNLVLPTQVKAISLEVSSRRQAGTAVEQQRAAAGQPAQMIHPSSPLASGNKLFKLLHLLPPIEGPGRWRRRV